MTHKQFAIKIAKRAGRIIKKNFVTGMKKEWKENDTPVTKTDLAINSLVIKEIKKYFPGQDVLGEEESYRKNKSDYLWVCDPVDGTMPFSHGLPICTFSLALVQKGRPILGVVYDPFIDRLWFAQKGKGAFMNGKRIHVSRRGMHRSVLNWESGLTMTELRKRFPTSNAFKLLSFIYGSMLVASGETVASLYPWNYPHDGATVKIIVEEAGGKVTDIDGKDQRYDGELNGCLATNGLVHKQLVNILKTRPRGTKLF